MRAIDILTFYDEYLKRYGQQVYLHFKEILADAKIQHKKDVDEFNAPLLEDEKKIDFEQSWRTVKGASLERLVLSALLVAFSQTPIKIIKGKQKVSEPSILQEPLKTIYGLLMIDYKTFGKHLPDIDLIVYTETPPHPIAILSIKTSLRERIAQAAYWTSKVHIPYLFITTDSDNVFLDNRKSKQRAVAETDTHGVYLLTEKQFTETEKVKVISSFNR